MVVGGDKLTYVNKTAAPAANLLETKIMLNSVISTKEAKLFTIDIKDFLLLSLMPQLEFMRLHQPPYRYFDAGVCKQLLARLAHPAPQKPVHAPHAWNTPIYGQHVQTSITDDASAFLPANEISRL